MDLQPRIDAEKGINRGRQILWWRRVGRWLGGIAGGGAVHRAGPGARSSEDRGKPLAPVVASIASRSRAADNRLANAWRTPHLASPDDQRLVQEPALVEIV